MVGWLDFFSSLEISSHSRGECDAIMDQKGQDGDFLVSFGNESNVTLTKNIKTKGSRFRVNDGRLLGLFEGTGEKQTLPGSCGSRCDL